MLQRYWEGKGTKEGPLQHLGTSSCATLPYALGRRRRRPRAALPQLAQAGKHCVCRPFLCFSEDCLLLYHRILAAQSSPRKQPQQDPNSSLNQAEASCVEYMVAVGLLERQSGEV